MAYVGLSLGTQPCSYDDHNPPDLTDYSSDEDCFSDGIFPVYSKVHDDSDTDDVASAL